MSTLLTALNPFVQPFVNSCPSNIVQHHVRQAAIEFCRRTLIWRKTLPAVASVLAPITFTADLVAALGGTLAAPFAGPTRTDYILTFSDSTYQTVTLTNGSTAVTWLNAVTATANATYSQTAYTIPATTDASISKLLKYTVDGVKRHVVNPDLGEDIVLWRYTQQGVNDIAWTTDRVNFNVSPPPTIAGTQYGLIVALQPTQTATTIPDDVFDGHAEDIAAGALARIFLVPKKDYSDTQQGMTRRAQFENRIDIVSAQAAKGFSRGSRRVRAHFF